MKIIIQIPEKADAKLINFNPFALTWFYFSYTTKKLLKNVFNERLFEKFAKAR